MPDMFFQVSHKNGDFSQNRMGRATHTFKDLANAFFLQYTSSCFVLYLGVIATKMYANTVDENSLKKSHFTTFSGPLWQENCLKMT